MKSSPGERRVRPGSCPWHPDEPATLNCIVCGIAGCSDCITPFSGKDLCPECRKRRITYRIRGLLISGILSMIMAVSGLLIFNSLSKEVKTTGEIEKYEKILKENPGDDFARIKLVALYENARRFDIAIANMERLIHNKPRETFYLRKTVRLCLKAGQNEKALSWAVNLNRREPDNSENLKLEGLSHLALHNFQEAEKTLLLAYSLYPRDMELIFTLTDMFTELNRPADALNIIRDALTRIEDESQRKLLKEKRQKIEKMVKKQ